MVPLIRPQARIHHRKVKIIVLVIELLLLIRPVRCLVSRGTGRVQGRRAACRQACEGGLRRGCALGAGAAWGAGAGWGAGLACGAVIWGGRRGGWGGGGAWRRAPRRPGSPCGGRPGSCRCRRARGRGGGGAAGRGAGGWTMRDGRDGGDGESAVGDSVPG